MTDPTSELHHALGAIEGKLISIEKCLETSKRERKEALLALADIQNKVQTHSSNWHTLTKVLAAFWAVALTLGGTIITWMLTHQPPSEPPQKPPRAIILHPKSSTRSPLGRTEGWTIQPKILNGDLTSGSR